MVMPAPMASASSPLNQQRSQLSFAYCTTLRNGGDVTVSCTLSSAIAGYMAKGKDIEAAVQKSKTFMNRAIAAGADYKLGHGHGPVHHFFQWWV